MTRAHDQRFTEAREYRGWAIDFVHPPIPCRDFDWEATHPEYDGAPDAHDNRHVHGATISDVMNEIDLFIEEHAA